MPPRIPLLGRSSARLIHSASGNIAPAVTASLKDHLGLSRLIREYEANGHFLANLDPLQLHRNVAHGRSLRVDSLRKEAHGFSDEDLTSKTFDISNEAFLSFLDKQSEPVTLGEILRALDDRFCGHVGVEYSHITNPSKTSWIPSNVLSKAEKPLSDDVIMHLLAHAQAFEEYCSDKFSAATHFSLEGGESLIVGIESALDRASELGISAVEFGMAHRGRLNVLRHVLKIPIPALLDRFESYLDDDAGLPNNSDDVRYHLGASVERKFINGANMRVSLAANPSHLEAVNSVVLGKARARQFLLTWGETLPDVSNRARKIDTSPSAAARKAVMPLLLHGDASFFQGSVRESLGFSTLKDYTTGGTVHVIVNNQVGFTTLPKYAHSGVYCSDVAKSVEAPIFHVNADFPQDVSRVFKAAVSYRDKFRSDVVVNLWCYRRRGHNQRDAPEISAPAMYAAIHRHAPVLDRFGSQSGLDAKKALQDAKKEMELEIQLMNSSTRLNLTRAESWVENESGSETYFDVRTLWNEIQSQDDPLHVVQVLDAFGGLDERWSGYNERELRDMTRTAFALPAELRVHPKVREHLEKRVRAADAPEGMVRWDLAEQLAFFTLMKDGVDVRLSGQDVERGTFGQRHAVVLGLESADGEEEFVYQPWSALLREAAEKEKRASASEVSPLVATTTISTKRRMGLLTVCNSPLSEESVLAFEHGNSLYSPSMLVAWEAQFGDFVNCAQTVVDAFLAGGEEKWARQSGLVLLLPHGNEGQGPDHSTAYVERFLSLCAEPDAPSPDFLQEEEDARSARRAANLHVLQPSTPAQYFHALRRHIISPFRKPLVLFTPKFLLHHSPCASSWRELGPEASFRVVLGEETARTAPPKRVVLCTGKIYYSLREELARREQATGEAASDIALVRIEQLCPFPFKALKRVVDEICRDAPARGAIDVVWAQEEGKNRGAWQWVQQRAGSVLGEYGPLRYVGRDPSAAAATGSYKRHKREEKRLIERALNVNIVK